VHFVPWMTADDQCTNTSIAFRLHRRLQPVFQFITTYLQAGNGLNGCRVVYCGEGQGGISWYVLPSRFCVSLVFHCSPLLFILLRTSASLFRLLHSLHACPSLILSLCLSDHPNPIFFCTTSYNLPAPFDPIPLPSYSRLLPSFLSPLRFISFFRSSASQLNTNADARFPL